MGSSGYINYRKGKYDGAKKIRTPLISDRFMVLLIQLMANNDVVGLDKLHNIEKFINSIDRNHYFKDPSLTSLILTVESFTNMRIRSNGKPIPEDILIVKTNTILNDETNESRDNLIIPTIINAKKDVDDTFEFDFIYKNIETLLKVNKVIVEKDKLIELTNEIDSNIDGNLEEYVSDFRKVLTDLLDYFAETDNDDTTVDIIHSSDDSFIEHMRDTYQKVKNPTSVLKTGLQMFNEMLGGGFYNSKYYMIYANTNTFKSALLLQIARWIKTYNSENFMNDPTFIGKIPTVLFVSAENSRQEDLERLFKMETSADIGNFDSVESMEKVWVNNEKNINSTIDVSFAHVNARSVNVTKIRNMANRLNSKGYRVIAILFDYLEMLAPEETFTKLDTRETLGRLSEGFLNLAKSLDIPVISAMQINRSGGKTLVDSKDSGELNAISKMNNSYIGESYNIEKATDFSMFIDLEINPHDNSKYLLFKKNKCRYSRTELDMFVHKITNGIVIEDDIYLNHPLSLHSLSYDSDGEKAISERTKTVGSRGLMVKKKKSEDIVKELSEKNKNMDVFDGPWNYSVLLDIDDVMCVSDIYSFEEKEEFDNYMFDVNDNGCSIF